jgi:hypothetical protein
MKIYQIPAKTISGILTSHSLFYRVSCLGSREITAFLSEKYTIYPIHKLHAPVLEDKIRTFPYPIV